MVEGKYPYMSNVITKDKRPMCTESKVIHQSYIFRFFWKMSVRVKTNLTFLIYFLLLDFFYLIFFLWMVEQKYLYIIFTKGQMYCQKPFIISCVMSHWSKFLLFWCFCVNSSCNKWHKYEPQSIQLNEINGFESKKDILFFN